jgi:hypothetical protein
MRQYRVECGTARIVFDPQSNEPFQTLAPVFVADCLKSEWQFRRQHEVDMALCS